LGLANVLDGQTCCRRSDLVFMPQVNAAHPRIIGVDRR
jgi:hypothetical protein